MEKINICYYINLNHRTDRKKYVEEQLSHIEIPYERIQGIHHENGAIGCSISHINCLMKAIENNYECIMIVEDDITFLNATLFKEQLSNFMNNDFDTFDVLLLGGNNIPPYKKVNDYCIKISRCQTTTGYIVHKNYYEILINNFKEGLLLLSKYPNLKQQYAIDKYWLKLQKKGNWFLLSPITVIQKPNDYSDIEEKITDYSNIMLDIDKKELIKHIENTKNNFNKSALNNINININNNTAKQPITQMIHQQHPNLNKQYSNININNINKQMPLPKYLSPANVLKQNFRIF